MGPELCFPDFPRRALFPALPSLAISALLATGSHNLEQSSVLAVH